MGLGVRKPVVAGSFYPSSKEELLLMLKNFFKNTKKILPNKKIKALIVPHAGYIYSGQTAAWAYRQLPEELKNQHFVLIGPSHYSTFEGLCVGRDHFWQTPLGKVKHLPVTSGVRSSRERNEHSLEVQLPFLQSLFGDFSISCFLTGYQVDYQKTAGFFLKNYSSSIFIISSDLSHYLPEGQAREKDRKTIEAILKLDSHYFATNENTACGEGGILILLAMAKKAGLRRRLIYYDNSSTASGTRGTVVGYAAVSFFI